MKKEVLVAVDGSAYSNQALSYIRTLFAEQDDIHFQLCTWVTAGGSVMPSAADSNNSLIPSGSSRSKKEADAKRYLEKATEKLTRGGIDPERINTSIQVSGYNIASAIEQTAKKGLQDSILVGRRGITGVSEMLMGSVSGNLFRSCHDTPLWIIDGDVQSKDFLVPVDGSVNALMAIDHLAHIFQGREDIAIHLFHCSALFGRKVRCDMELFHSKWDKEWCNAHLSGNDCLFNGPRQLLMDAGIPDSQIKILKETPGLEEAHGILREAKKQKCGTIVIGRRGKGITKGILGGVSDRAMKHVQDVALWIVG